MFIPQKIQQFTTPFLSCITLLVALPILSAQPIAQLTQTLKPDLPVSSVAFSPDDTTLVTGSAGYLKTWEDGREVSLKCHTGGLQFWNARTATLLKTITLPNLPVLSVAISPDGQTLATAHQSEIRLWSFQTGELKHVIKTKATQVVFSPDGKFLVNGTHENAANDANGYMHRGRTIIRVWDTQDGRLLQTWTYGDEKLWQGSQQVTVSFLPDAETLAATDANRTRLLNITDGKLLRIPRNIGEQPVFSPNGQLIASLDIDVIGPNFGVYVLVLSDAQTWQSQKRLTSSGAGGVGEHENVTAMAFSPDGKILVAGVQAKVQEIRFWDTKTKKLQQSFKGRNDDSWTWSFAFSHDGKILAGGGEHSITLWRMVQ
jgi:WD40 repeat protein